MKRLVPSLMLALVLASGLLAGCAQQSASSDSAITVSAEAQVDIVPDQAALVLSASASGATADETLAAGAAAADAIVERLEALGVDAADIQTSQVSLTERRGQWTVRQITDGYFDYDGNWVEYVVDEVPYDGTADIIGYDASVSIDVAHLKTQDVGTVISSAVDAGATGISGLSFTVSDREAAYQQALAAAVDAAHTKATSLAKASDVYVGRVVNLVENTSSAFEATVAGDPSAIDTASDSLNVEPGVVSVEASVTVSYAIS